MTGHDVTAQLLPDRGTDSEAMTQRQDSAASQRGQCEDPGMVRSG